MSVSPDVTGASGHDDPVQGMPVEVPECGRVGCNRRSAHKHPETGTGDRVVVEPKLATAPGWTYRSPHGTVVSIQRTVGGQEVVVDLDDGTRQSVSVHNVTKRATFMNRNRSNARRIPTMGRPAKPLEGAEEPELF